MNYFTNKMIRFSCLLKLLKPINLLNIYNNIYASYDNKIIK